MYANPCRAIFLSPQTHGSHAFFTIHKWTKKQLNEITTTPDIAGKLLQKDKNQFNFNLCWLEKSHEERIRAIYQR